MNKNIFTENKDLAIMLDSLKIGIFFMDRNYIIQDHYSGYLGAMFSNPNLAGISLIDLIAPQVSQGNLYPKRINKTNLHRKSRKIRFPSSSPFA